MKLSLRNGSIIIDDSGTLEQVSGVSITYDYELGTNHYTTITTINNKKYIGSHINVPLDLSSSSVDIKVELFDTHNTIMRTYIGTFAYLKLCVIDRHRIFNIYEELDRLYKENKELREKGDVI